MVSMNMWAGYPDFLQYIKEGFPAFLEQLGEHPEKKEYLLPNIVAELLEKKRLRLRCFLHRINGLELLIRKTLSQRRKVLAG